MILSSGMCSLDEVDETVEALRRTGIPFALMNCVSEYPPVYEDINLNVIRVMMDRYPEITIGHSDHTPDLYTSWAAVSLGARIVEKHIILDKLQPGPDQSVSIDMMGLHELATGIRKIERAMGSEKKVHTREKAIRTWAFRSVVTVKPVAAGQIITEDMVWTKRPGTGIPSKRLHEIIGRRALRDLAKNTLISWNDLE
jgi:N-acetylneuraminate synthase